MANYFNIDVEKLSKSTKNFFVRQTGNLVNFLEAVYYSFFGFDYTNEDITEWQNIVLDNSINSKLDKKLEKYGLFVVEKKTDDLLKINDVLLSNGYETNIVKMDESIKELDHMVKLDGNLFIYSIENMDLDFLKNNFKEKCKVFIFQPEKLDLRYKLSSNENEVLENPEDTTEADMIVISTNDQDSLNKAFLSIYKKTRGIVPVKVFIRLLKKDANYNIFVEYSRKGACNRLVSEYITGAW